MKKKSLILITVFLLTLLCIVFWYVNFYSYKSVAENRIDVYMKAQKVNFDQKYQKRSYKDFKTGRWMVTYKFQEEPSLIYEYEYDRSTNSVLLIVYESATMTGGSSIEQGMLYPSLEDGWSEFDSKGKLIITNHN